jgi:hypothetical protein
MGALFPNPVAIHGRKAHGVARRNPVQKAAAKKIQLRRNNP